MPIVQLMYLLLWENRIHRLEQFLTKQQRNPNLYLYYLMANNRTAEAEALLEKLLAKHKNQARRSLYTAMYATHQKNTDAIRNVLADLPAGQLRSYYEAIVRIEEGHLEEARRLAGVQNLEVLFNRLIQFTLNRQQKSESLIVIIG
ncbi:hypothetical protein WMW72_07105 [Paenibacillus filicis]|uniref:Uncharacterized protein n=1 Tax=Paenibacillus filicis TaxID=669464 RepID=A0ABU9DFM9_9BACL